MGERAHVFNASPLILLARAECLVLAKALGADLRVPARVFQELEAGAARDASARRVETSGFFRIVPDGADPRVAAWGLDPGETSVLSLALEEPGSVAVLDDLAARRCATSLGVPLIGTAGLVALCKQRGLIGSARETLTLLRQHGLYLDVRVEVALLRSLGEGP